MSLEIISINSIDDFDLFFVPNSVTLTFDLEFFPSDFFLFTTNNNTNHKLVNGVEYPTK